MNWESNSGRHPHDDVEEPSDRKFALSFAAIFLFIAAYGYWKSGHVATGLVALAALFAGLGWLAPRMLHPLNVAWLKLGLLLYRVVSPVIMAIMYLVAIVPMGIALRLAGKDLLGRKPDRSGTASYWHERSTDDGASPSFKNQF